MTPKEFVLWLKGVDVGLSGHPYEGTWNLIQEKLNEVKMEDGPSRIIPSRDIPMPDSPSIFPSPCVPTKIPPSPGSPPEIIC
jgi:hypothetical protein